MVLFFSLGVGSYAASNKAFIYSLYNINDYSPVKMPIEATSYAIRGCSSDGPVFGGDDIFIVGEAGSARLEGSTYCGASYTQPPGSSSGQLDFYTGSSRFFPTDIEVLYETII